MECIIFIFSEKKKFYVSVSFQLFTRRLAKHFEKTGNRRGVQDICIFCRAIASSGTFHIGLYNMHYAF